MTDTSDIDPTDLLEPDDQTTAKSLHGRYRALEDYGIDVHCDRCNAPPVSPARIVATFPRPWSEEGKMLLCYLCWAGGAERHTTLDLEQTELLALKQAGLTIPEMSSATGRDEDEIEEELRQMGERAESIKGQVRRVQRTNGLLADVLG